MAPRSPTTPITPADFEQLGRALSSDISLQGVRDRAIVLLAIVEGLQPSEIGMLNDNHFTPPAEAIMLPVPRKNQELFPIQHSTFDALLAYISLKRRTTADDQGIPLFVRINKSGVEGGRISPSGIKWIINAVLAAAGLNRPGVSLRSLRIAFRGMMPLATVDQAAVKQAMRSFTGLG